MTNTEEVIAEARSWIGTPFRHQGRRKKTSHDKGGVDCLGLLIGVAQVCGLRAKDGSLLHHHDALSYGHMPDGIALREGLKAALIQRECGAPEAGDVGLFEIDGVVRHVAFFGDYACDKLSLIHAYAPSRKVVEHRFDDVWQGRLAGVFSIPIL